MHPEVLMVLALFGVVSALPFKPGPKLTQLLDDKAELKGQDQRALLAALEKELGLEDVQTLSVERHQLLVPPNLVVHLCLQTAPVWHQLKTHGGACPAGEDQDLNLACMLGKMAVASPDAGVDDATLGPALRECREWWRLAGEAGKAGGGQDAELGRCLLHTVSVACHPKMENVIKTALHK